MDSSVEAATFGAVVTVVSVVTVFTGAGAIQLLSTTPEQRSPAALLRYRVNAFLLILTVPKSLRGCVGLLQAAILAWAHNCEWYCELQQLS